MGVFKVHQQIHFNCGLRYYNPDWTLEKNQAVYHGYFSEYGYGHNFILEIVVTGPRNSQTGILIEAIELKKILENIVKPLDHKFLNTDVDFFQKNVPTIENIARYCFLRSKDLLKDNQVKLEGVRLFQGETFCVEVYDDPNFELSK